MLRFNELWQFDWGTFMAGTAAWLHGANPYGAAPGTMSPGGLPYPQYPPYPPTALTWMAPFVPLGAASFYVWTALEIVGWWLLVRDRCRSNLILLAWAPVLLHLVLGQCSLAMILVMWAAYRAPRRAFGWGLLLAFCLTKPQVALLPFLYLLWHDRNSPTRGLLLSGIALGTLALALPPTLKDPAIWTYWWGALTGFGKGLLHLAAWQNWGIIPLLVAAYLWHRRHADQSTLAAKSTSMKTASAGWMWWLAASVFPQGSYYGVVPMVPILRPARNYWSIVGFAISACIQGPASPVSLPLILALHMLAAWFIAGGPQRDQSTLEAQSPSESPSQLRAQVI